MIAAVFDGRPRPDVASWLRRLQAAAGHRAVIVADVDVGLAAWPEMVPRGGLDAARSFAWLGRVSGPTTPLDLEASTRLRGDFACASREHTPAGSALLLARGRFGGRPLFYAHPLPGVAVACSRLSWLLALLADDPAPCLSEIAALAALRAPSDDARTVHEGVRRVRSAEALRIDRVGIVSRRWSVVAPPATAVAAASPQELAEELETRLRQAVRRATQGHRRVAVAFSGGVDSSAVLAATRTSGFDPPNIYALSFEIAGAGDDRPHRGAVCSALGVAPIVLDPRSLPTPMDAAVLDAAPVRWPTSGMTVGLMVEARARGATLVLTGVGGDDLFDGDPRCFAERALRGRPLSAIHRAATLRGPYRESLWWRTRDAVLVPAVRRLLPQAVATRARRTPGAWGWTGERWPPAEPIELGPWRTEERRIDHLSRAWFYAACIAESRGQVEAVGGVEQVDPMFDDDVIEFVATLPSEALLAGGWRRGLLRLAFARLLPASSRLRPDKARVAPAIAAQLAGSAACREWFRDLGTGERLAAAGIVKAAPFREAVRRYTDDLPSRCEDLGRLWGAVTCEAFLRERARGVRWLGEARSRGVLLYRVGRAADEWVLDFPAVGTVRSTRDRSRVTFEAAPGADPIRVAKFRASLEPAFLRHLEGQLSLHGSAVAFGGRAIACVGDSGAGKSTTAAMLCAEVDGALLADDAIHVVRGADGPEVEASHDLHWLWPSSRAALGLCADDPRKTAVPATHPARGRFPLAAVVTLAFHDAPSVTRRLRGVAAIEALLPHVVRLVLDEPEVELRELEQLTELANLPVYEHRRPRAAGSPLTIDPLLDALGLSSAVRGRDAAPSLAAVESA